MVLRAYRGSRIAPGGVEDKVGFCLFVLNERLKSAEMECMSGQHLGERHMLALLELMN